MIPLPQRPAVPGARGNALGHSGLVVVAARVAWLRRLLRCRRCERPLLLRPRRRRRPERPFLPSPTAVSWLREATALSARSVVVVARGRWLPRPRRCHRCERRLAPSPTAVSSFGESPGAGPPRWPSAGIAERFGSRPRYTLRGWLARFSPTPSSRNYSCSRPSNQRFQPGSWPCSSGVEVGQAQAEPRVGPPLRRRVRPVSSCATPRCDSQFFRLMCPQRCSIGLFAGAALRDSILHLPRRPSSYRHFAALFAPSPSPSSALRCQIRAVAHSPPACRSSMRLLAHPVLAPWMLYSPGNTTRPPRCERFSSRAQTPVSSLRHFGDAHASPTAPHSLPTRGSTPDGLSTGSPRGRIAICPPPL
jgi:hypothetical protein